MNVAYEETEKRSFIKLNLTAFAFTLGAMLLAIIFIVILGVTALQIRGQRKWVTHA